MQLRKAEKTAIAEALSTGAESPEQLATDVASLLDSLRAQRMFVYGCFTYAGIPGVVGPYTTRGQAEKALAKVPADKTWVVPGWTGDGWARHIAELDEKPKARPVQDADNSFWSKVSEIRNGERTAISGKVEIRRVRIP